MVSLPQLGRTEATNTNTKIQNTGDFRFLPMAWLLCPNWAWRGPDGPDWPRMWGFLLSCRWPYVWKIQLWPKNQLRIIRSEALRVSWKQLSQWVSIPSPRWAWSSACLFWVTTRIFPQLASSLITIQTWSWWVQQWKSFHVFVCCWLCLCSFWFGWGFKKIFSPLW